jgi:hypothetical protein
MTPGELTALTAYAERRRADMTAAELAAARHALAAAGYVRNSSGRESPMFVEVTTAGRTALTAEWIAANVLTAAYIDSCGGLGLIRMCACQYGPCGWCSSFDKHDRCHTKQVAPMAGPDTYVQACSGTALAAVWRSGTSCRWVCPCVCPEAEPKPSRPVAKVEAPHVEQLGLFDLAGAS